MIKTETKMIKPEPTEKELEYLRLWEEWESWTEEPEEKKLEPERNSRLRDLIVAHCIDKGTDPPDRQSPYAYMFISFCGAVDFLQRDSKEPETGKDTPKQQPELTFTGGKGQKALTRWKWLQRRTGAKKYETETPNRGQ